MNPNRVVIIHNHLFKNAGTTIDFALRRNFGDQFLDHRDDESMMKGSSYLGPFLLENPDIVALSTHNLTLPLPALEGVYLPMIMMLRHPIERVTSVYHFERKQLDSDTEGAVYARGHSLKEYIQWRMIQSVTNTVRNFYMGRSMPPRPSANQPFTKNEFHDACDFLRNVEMLGFVDQFDESMVLFEEFLKPIFPEINLAYIPKNVSQEFKTIEERVGELEEELGTSLFDAFYHSNKNDLALFERVKEFFVEKIQAVSAFESKLQEFKERCDLLRNGKGRNATS